MKFAINTLYVPQCVQALKHNESGTLCTLKLGLLHAEP